MIAAASMLHLQPSSTLPATYRLATGVACEVHDHDLSPVGFRLFLSALTNALAFSCSRTPSPEVLVDYFNRNQVLLTGWYAIRSSDKELACDIAEYDVGTYSRFCLDHKFLYIVFRRHDPTCFPSPPTPSVSDQEAAASEDDAQSVDSVRADEEDVAVRSPKGKRRIAMRWTATDLENLRSGVAQFGKDWHAILNTYDFRGRNTRVCCFVLYIDSDRILKALQALSERWHRLTAMETTTEELKSEVGADENADDSHGRRQSLSASKPRTKRVGRTRRSSAPETSENGERSHICATQRFYTEKEEQNLRDGVAKFGQDWPRILTEYWGDNPDRSTKSLAKKWRVLSGIIETETDDKGSDANPDEAMQDEARRRRRAATAGGEPVAFPMADIPDNDTSISHVSGQKRARRTTTV